MLTLSPDLTRRGFLVRSAAVASAVAATRVARSQRSGGVGGTTVVIGLAPEPLTLSSAASIDTGTINVSAKIFDRLFSEAGGYRTPLPSGGTTLRMPA
jgi:hypothetical protein